MTKTTTKLLIASLILGAATPAFADDDWSADDQAKCTAEFDQKAPEFVNGGWVTYKNGKPHGPEKATADCKAVVEKHAEVCLADAAQQKKKKTSTIIKNGGSDQLYCENEAWMGLLRTRQKADAEAKKVEDKRKADEKRKADADKATVPAAGKKDATIEAWVKAAFAKAYPDAKILKVLLVSDDWSTERNDYGTVIGRNIQAVIVNQQKDVCEVFSEEWYQEYIGGAFKGPLTERGAGSLQRYDITCSKVTGK